MDKEYDVVALGELLIDFTESGLSAQGNPLLEVNPGGAPGNVLSMLQNYGRKTAFIGKVGKDMFGRLLLEAVGSCGIDTKAILQDETVHTTLAFVQTFEDGDRDFSFYRDPGADMMLRPEEVQEELIAASRIFHFGSLSMTHPTVREATRQALRLAKKHGCLISFDPNLREPLWSDLAEAKRQIEWGLARCDILKISDNEVLFVTGETDFEKGASILLDRFPNIRLLNITAGPDGSHCFFGGRHVFVPGFKVRTIETTGAGDTFCACVLHDVLSNGVESRSEQSLTDMLRFANAAAYLVTTKKGAIRSMPEKADVLEILAQH